jgi:hypothetical protein
MVMGKTLEEDFQKEHKNSNGCTSSRSVCRPADAAPKHQYQDLYAAMVMGKTLEEDFQKEHKNSNGCTSSRSVCRPDLYLQRRERARTHTHTIFREREHTHTHTHHI